MNIPTVAPDGATLNPITNRNMKKNLIVLALAVASLVPAQGQTLKEAAAGKFLMGAAVNTDVVWERDAQAADIVKQQFNSIVAENCMKGEKIHPEEHRYDWADADQTMKFGEENGMTVIGHTLVWHSQPPVWMFTDSQGKRVSREVLIDRMYHHITDVVSRYKGRIKGWDVINEAFNDDGTYRKTPYYEIIGPDYFVLAFQFAHAADPDAELYYNDYSLDKPAKRDAVVRLVKMLKDKGCRIDAVGMQSHCGLGYPNMSDYEQSIQAFIGAGVNVQFTELDMNVLPNPKGFGGAAIEQNSAYLEQIDPYRKGLPKKVEKQFNQRYLDLFNLYNKYADHVNRVTFWGVYDKTSWLNDWPVHGRTNYPLFFDRNYKAKPVMKEVVKLLTDKQK